ncbi:DNA-directed RNA polymerase I subunit RPA49-like isoform X2 [Diorhabda sublineata]|uniref:DNA-directed RNA polymerase I subunit RPA49-like isoform X2 n=1 Tax=Diorhabda sublineata TaxID=1163346 RepID=UPI0024E18851|nr:DNA-directed RNA polymerase I subunit RPA49-like isoform X2 [Diorhabda sublineata]
MPVIRKVVTKQTGHRPILINFDNSKVKPESVNTLEAQLYETVLSEKLIAVTSNKLLYTGEVEDDELYHNFIVIHKRDSDQITLFQYDRATVQARFNKKRKFEISPIKDNAAAELNKQFGSKKAKRVTEQRERLTMNIDAVKQQLEQTVAGLKVDNVEQVVENESIYRPKINRDASSPDGVYNLEDLVEAYILDTLAVEAGKIIEAGSADQFGFCKFVTTNMNKLLTSNISEEDKIRSLTIFLYIHYLIVYIKTPMKSITKKFVVCDKSVDINNHILKVFSEVGANGSRTRPLHMKDKALCYTMILAAIAMEFEVDVELLSKDLKIGMKKVVEVARILAFNMKANNKNIVQLKLPLPAPVAYSPKKGRR